MSNARVVAPMQGTIVAVDVASGDSVIVGQQVMLIESMKMHHAIESHESGTVAEILVDVGQTVMAGEAANAFVEDCVRAHPVDWFWVHKRWPDKVYAALREADQAT